MTKIALAMVLTAALTSNALAGVTARVYLADEKTPLALVDPNVPDVFRDIMVGTHLTIFIESDVPEFAVGTLRIPWEDQVQGFLAGRGHKVGDVGNVGNYWDSCLEAAGLVSFVGDTSSAAGVGLVFGTDPAPSDGKWFVFDYWATNTGICEVDRYDYLRTPFDRVQVLSFAQVPSRNFNDDTIVNFADFAHLASQWDGPAIADPNLNGSPDLNADDLVDTLDMLLFSDYWLERTDFNEPQVEPNIPGAEPEGPQTSF